MSPATSARKASPAPSAASGVSLAVAMAVTVPIVVATLTVGAFACAELLGRPPLSYLPPRNVAEAAGMGSGSEVLRLLRQGENPRQILEIRPEIISSSITRVSALEAAIWSRRVELVKMLDRLGFITEDMRRDLVCLASDIESRDILDHLAPTGVSACDPGAAIRRVEARSP